MLPKVYGFVGSTIRTSQKSATTPTTRSIAHRLRPESQAPSRIPGAIGARI